MKFIELLKSFLSNKDILVRLSITFIIIVIYRFLSKIPVPGIERDALATFFSNQQGETIGLFNVANILSGDSLSNFSIISFGVVAYVSASIIMQLLGVIIPKIEEIRKMGAVGTKILDQWTRILTVPLVCLQGVGMYLALSSSNNPLGRPILDPIEFNTLRVISTIAVLVAGTMLLMWLAEILTESGISGAKRGGGFSVIITAGILSSLPAAIVNDFSNIQLSRFLQNMWIALLIQFVIFLILLILFVGYVKLVKYVFNLKTKAYKIIGGMFLSFVLLSIPIIITFVVRSQDPTSLYIKDFIQLNLARLNDFEVKFGFFIGILLQVIGIIVYFNESVRKIPIRFVSQITVRTNYVAEKSSFIPVKFFIIGIIPTIFSMSFLAMPEFVYRFFGNSINDWNPAVGEFVRYMSQGWFNQFNSEYYYIVSFMLTVFFSLFYVNAVIKPEDIAENLSNMNSFIPGLRPGKDSLEYISRIFNYMAFWGGIILAFSTVAPFLLGVYSQTTISSVERLLAGGTSLLILVPTFLSIKDQVLSMILTKNYDKYREI